MRRLPATFACITRSPSALSASPSRSPPPPTLVQAPSETPNAGRAKATRVQQGRPPDKGHQTLTHSPVPSHGRRTQARVSSERGGGARCNPWEQGTFPRGFWVRPRPGWVPGGAGTRPPGVPSGGNRAAQGTAKARRGYRGGSFTRERLGSGLPGRGTPGIGGRHGTSSGAESRTASADGCWDASSLALAALLKSSPNISNTTVYFVMLTFQKKNCQEQGSGASF